jgi:ribosomal protein S18 acetylase RimI-like enzyme
VSPTILRIGGYRFYFFSREEPRAHVHVQHSNGQAKFWLEPEVQFAQDYGLGYRQISTAFRLIKENEDEIRVAWEDHFDRRG